MPAPPSVRRRSGQNRNGRKSNIMPSSIGADGRTAKLPASSRRPGAPDCSALSPARAAMNPVPPPAVRRVMPPCCHAGPPGASESRREFLLKQEFSGPRNLRNRGDSVLTEEKHPIRVLFFRDHGKPGVNAARGGRASRRGPRRPGRGPRPAARNGAAGCGEPQPGSGCGRGPPHITRPGPTDC